MGLLGRLPTSVPNAMKQILERLSARRHKEDLLNPTLMNEIATSKKNANLGYYDCLLENMVNCEIRTFLRWV